MQEQILVVDDEADMRTALTHVLHKKGYAVKSAASGPEALKKFNNDKFSMVITDVKMPDMSGMEVLGAIKKKSPEVPVIMISAYGTIGKAVDAMKKGASDYLVKPFSSESIEMVVRRFGGQLACKPLCRKDDTEKRDDLEEKGIITQDPGFRETIKLAKNVAASNATILLQGESGTGKEMFASFIHHHSTHKNGPYIAVNCAALPDGLAESELFGHEKGAFTGALNQRKGKFELANNGTIVLDEISEMSLQLQAKLLRVLQEREVIRVGGTQSILINSRIVAICNIDLEAAVNTGRFREDLFYRINVIPITIPPLRDRKKDIPVLAKHFLEKYSNKNNRKMLKIADETLSLLLKYNWSGNIRELENTMERAVLLGEGDTVLPGHLFLEINDNNKTKDLPVIVGQSLKEMEKELIFQTLKEVDDNRTHAAKILGISIRTLRNKLREYRNNP
ncbi:MAG: sigma-54-dependent Fis family transcriptional regulator [Deltaproteobacteria bacterium]|nr:sigma-54-dependent Fis family transcriptional regulator [Deltaproteobacteria bacterium]